MNAPDRDPRIERAAVALAWAERIPAFLPRLDELTRDHELMWWNALPATRRDGYRYRAAVALDAADEREAVDAE